jgi:Niemann-Pick C1 protein
VRSARARRARRALATTGSSVITGITLTKLSGVLVLAAAPSALFRLYYFRMYLAIVVVGAFHGLAVLPVLLATFG